MCTYYCVSDLHFLFMFNRKLCCSTIKSLFTNEGKHGGEATVEAVRLISEHVKAHNCQMHPDSVEVRVPPLPIFMFGWSLYLLNFCFSNEVSQSETHFLSYGTFKWCLFLFMFIQVFLSLSFDEDLGKSEKKDEDQKFKKKKGWKRKNMEPSNQLPENDRKRSRKDSISKTKEEVIIFPHKNQSILVIFVFGREGIVMMLCVDWSWVQGCIPYHRCYGEETDANWNTLCCVRDIFSHFEAHDAFCSCQVYFVIMCITILRWDMYVHGFMNPIVHLVRYLVN